MQESQKDSFLEKLKQLSIQKYEKEEGNFEYGKAIRCLSPDHEDRNPSMVINKKSAICKSCGYTISKNKKVKPFKQSVTNLVVEKFIELSKKHTPHKWITERKYNPNTIKELGLGYVDYDVYVELIEEFGQDNVKKAKLTKNKFFSFVNKILIPISKYYFSLKPSDVSYPGEKQPYIINGQEPVIICEGETDAIALHHIYPQNKKLALRGAQSQQPLKDLFENEIWLCFDNDTAGKKAEFEAANTLQLKTLKKINFPTNYKDIDELWRDKESESQKHITLTEIKPTDILIPEDHKPITKEEYKAVIEKNFPNLWETVDVALSVISINKLKKWTDPVNINLVGPPSSQKTTALSFFYEIPGIINKSDNFTPKSFVSHSITSTEEELEEIDLLPRIKDKCFMTPELAPLFGKRKEDLIETIGIMTRVYDGEGFESDSGAKGRRGYTGEHLFTHLGATTPLPKTAWNIMGRMGSRMFMYNVPDERPDEEQLLSIFGSQESYGDKIKACKAASKRMIYSIYGDGHKRNVEWDSINNERAAGVVCASCATLLSKLRASVQVWDDEFSESKVQHETPLIEISYRIMNIFMNVCKGHAISEGRNFIVLDDAKMIPKVMSSTMPEDRLNCWRAILPLYESDFNVEEVTDLMGVSQKVARKILKTMEILEIIEAYTSIRDKTDYHSREPANKKYYKFSDDVKQAIQAIIHAFPKTDNVMKIFFSAFPKITSVSAKLNLHRSAPQNQNQNITKTNIKNALTLVENGKGENVLENEYIHNFDDVLAKISDSPNNNAVQLIEEFGEELINQMKQEGVIVEMPAGTIRRM